MASQYQCKGNKTETNVRQTKANVKKNNATQLWNQIILIDTITKVQESNKNQNDEIPNRKCIKLRSHDETNTITLTHK